MTEDEIAGRQESITGMYWERMNINVIFSRVSDLYWYFLSFKKFTSCNFSFCTSILFPKC